MRKTVRKLIDNCCGQAAVEFVALFPFIVLICTLLIQVLVICQAYWLSGSAASAAARRQAVGGGKREVRKAAMSKLPGYLERKLKVQKLKGEDEGEVKVTVKVPTVIGLGSLTDISAQASFARQE